MMDKRFDSKSIEDKWYKIWLDSGAFSSNSSSTKKPYVIMMPPPNVTGSLHIGHALTFTIQDILIRFHRMQGFDVLWQPGTDHAGIATQMVVERELAKLNLTRHSLGREKFVEKVWEWKEKSGGEITNQLRALGASPDWEKERFTMDDGLSKAVNLVFVKLYKEGLRAYLQGKFMSYVGLSNLAKQVEMADFEKMEQIRSRADSVVNDPKTAESLKPYYRQFCKRPCFHDEYLSAFNNENVELVDTDGRGIDTISEKGIIFDGKEYEVDCIIFATGFEVGTEYTRRCGYEIYGKEGVSISDKWKDGLSTFHGMHTRSFPNCFFFGPQQGAFTANYTHSLDEQSIHLSYILKKMKEDKLTFVEASEHAEQDWVEKIIHKSRDMKEFRENCTPGYYNNEGKPDLQPQNNPYGGGPLEFFSMMRKWRKEGKLEGLEVSGN